MASSAVAPLLQRGSVLRPISRRVDWIPVGDKWCRMSIMGADLTPEALQRDPITSSTNGSISDTPKKDNRVVILMIPGNPGNEGFYANFGELLLRNLMSRDERTGRGSDHTYLFYTISHLNHIALPTELRQNSENMKPTDRFLLDAQIQHKLDFVREFLPRAGKVYILGHSIGSYMMLRLLPYIVDDFNICKAVALFPTVERMAESPNGIRLRRLLAALDTNDWLTKGISFWLDYLPVGIKKTLVGLNLRGDGIPPSVIDTAAELLHMNVFRNIVHMSNEELDTVCEFDASLIKHKDLIYFYYGTADGWCPLDYGMEMQDRMPPSHVIIDDKNCEHAFCIRDDKVMAEKMVALIT